MSALMYLTIVPLTMGAWARADADECSAADAIVRLVSTGTIEMAMYRPAASNPRGEQGDR